MRHATAFFIAFANSAAFAQHIDLARAVDFSKVPARTAISVDLSRASENDKPLVLAHITYRIIQEDDTAIWVYEESRPTIASELATRKSVWRLAIKPGEKTRCWDYSDSPTTPPTQISLSLETTPAENLEESELLTAETRMEFQKQTLKLTTFSYGRIADQGQIVDSKRAPLQIWKCEDSILRVRTSILLDICGLKCDAPSQETSMPFLQLRINALQYTIIRIEPSDDLLLDPPVSQLALDNEDK